MNGIGFYLRLVLVAGLTGLFSSAGNARAEEILREISWSELSRKGEIRSGEILVPGDETPFEHLKMENCSAQGATFTVCVLEAPGVTQSRYAVRGTVSYRGVEGEGYLEMWSVFPDGGEYFSRTTAPSGPLKSLTGDSDWRPFVLPFFITEGEQRPERLVVNVVLPGDGVVVLSPLRLIQYAPHEDPLAQEGQWWGESTGGLVGGVLGSALGCLGGLIGWLGSKGRARRFVLGALTVLMILGIVSLVLGGVALFRSQPYAVYYPLVLLGIIATLAPSITLPLARKRYLELELRKMKAMDVS
jgi:hypothetical protein